MRFFLFVPHKCPVCLTAGNRLDLPVAIFPHVQSFNRKNNYMAGFPPTFDCILSQQWLIHNFPLAKDQAEASLKSFATFFFPHTHLRKSKGVTAINDNWVPSSFPANTLEITPPNGMQLPLMLLITPVLFLL